MKLVCDNCHKSYTRFASKAKGKHRFCSRACYLEFIGFEAQELYCVNCGKRVKRRLQKKHIERNTNYYCNKRCYLEYTGRKKIIVNNDFFHYIDTEKKAYWLGFIYADGCLRSGKHILQVGLSAKDKLHLQKLSSIFNKKIYEYDTTKNNKVYNTAIFSVCSSQLWNDLCAKGVKPRKTYVGDGTVFQHVSGMLLHHFVRGFFDGDGSVSTSYNKIRNKKSNYNVSFAGTEKFLSTLKTKIIDVIALSDIAIEQGKGVKILRWSGREQVTLLGNWLYKEATVFLERKKKRFDEYAKDMSIRGSSNYRGVVWHENNKKWLANISYDKKRINLGYYVDEKDAAIAYDKAVLKYNKPLYKLNFQ